MKITDRTKLGRVRVDSDELINKSKFLPKKTYTKYQRQSVKIDRPGTKKKKILYPM